MNFLTSKYLPVLCSDGCTEVVAPYELSETESGRIPVAYAFADNLLNFVAVEMVAGFFQVLMAPDSERAWKTKWKNPPSREEILSAFSNFEKFFHLHGDVPAFQDNTAVDAKVWGVEKLFHLSPGDNTQKHNKDMFGGRFEAIGVGSAMVALYAMQAHANSAGAGYRTSLSGGGPLRTIPDIGGSLFHKSWGLVVPAEQFVDWGSGQEDAVFPWVKPAHGKLNPSNTPASHLYFAIPRRIMLGDIDGEGVCPLSGVDGPTISSIRETNKGPDYDSSQWRHPLTPYRKTQKGKSVDTTPVLATYLSNGFSWNQRSGLFQSRERKGGGIETAFIVNHWRTIRSKDVLDDGFIPVLAYGVRCSNATVLGLTHGFHPFKVSSEKIRHDFDILAQSAVQGAEEIQILLRWSVRDAAFTKAEQKKLSPDAMGTRINPVIAAFWSSTEQLSNNHLSTVSALLEAGEAVTGDAMTATKEAFCKSLANAALKLFDEVFRDAMLDAPERISEARQRLKYLENTKPVRAAFGLPERENRKKK